MNAAKNKPRVFLSAALGEGIFEQDVCGFLFSAQPAPSLNRSALPEADFWWNRLLGTNMPRFWECYHPYSSHPLAGPGLFAPGQPFLMAFAPVF